MEPHVKGQTLKSLLLFMQQKMQPPQIEQVLSKMDADTRQQIDKGILATRTFPMAMLNRLTIEGAKVASVPLEEFAREAGSFSAAEAVKGVYRLFARVLTPDAILSRAAAMWSSMNTAGKMEVMADRGSAVLRLIDYPSQPVMCMRITGWIEKMADMTGAKNAVVKHVSCVTKGARSCDWTITW
ncbi:MAG TPA: hypothetical protein VLU46_16005 [Thermoanaerobaculia bacterium]|nr:hypothetical protein [Thermoanaerobaculia bacterium]